MKVAIVYDWLTDLGGAERLTLALQDAFPDAPIYTSVYEPEKRLLAITKGRDIRTTWLQNLPKPLRRFHRLFPVLRVWAFRSLDLSEYDIVISSASAEAKNVRLRKDAVHICYCHTPIRYYWSNYDEYKKEPGFGKLNWLIRLLMPVFVPPMRWIDYRAAQKVDYFIANSSEVQKRIKKYYKRDSEIIYPPVNLSRFTKLKEPARRHGFLAGSRHVAYKRLDLAIAACNKLKLPLTVYGDGPEYARHVAMAGPTITFVPKPTDEEVARLFKNAEAYIFSSFEDFGIVQTEALAAGTPVIAYARGGSRDIVTPENGVTFAEQTVGSLVTAINKFQKSKFDHQKVAATAKRFSQETFTEGVRLLVDGTKPKT